MGDPGNDGRQRGRGLAARGRLLAGFAAVAALVVLAVALLGGGSKDAAGGAARSSATTAGDSSAAQAAEPAPRTRTSTGAAIAAQPDPVSRTTAPSKARIPKGGIDDEAGASGARQLLPCYLVARAEASTILGQAVAEPQSVLQGPSCLYRVKGRERVVALSVAPGSISTIQRRGRDVIKLRLRNRAGFCVNYGRPKVIVPLTRGRLLSVAAPCQIAARFASVALPRIPS